MVIKCIHSKTESDEISGSYDIAAVPTGKCVGDVPEDWKSNLLIQAFHQCGKQFTIPLILCTSPVNIAEEILGNVAVGGISESGTVGGTAGDTAGAIAGTTTTPVNTTEKILGNVAVGGISESGTVGGTAGDTAGAIAGTTTTPVNTTEKILGNVAVGGISGVVGGTAGGIAGAIAGTTTTLSTTFMGITIGAKTAALLNVATGLVLPGITVTKTVATTTVALGAVGAGIGGGVIVAVGVGLAFKTYVWPIVKEKIGDDTSDQTKKNQ